MEEIYEEYTATQTGGVAGEGRDGKLKSEDGITLSLAQGDYLDVSTTY